MISVHRLLNSCELLYVPYRPSSGDEQTVNLSAIVSVLVQHLSGDEERCKFTVLRWLHHLLKHFPNKVAAYTITANLQNRLYTIQFHLCVSRYNKSQINSTVSEAKSQHFLCRIFYGLYNAHTSHTSCI